MMLFGGLGAWTWSKWVTDTANKCFWSQIYEKTNKETLEETLPPSRAELAQMPEAHKVISGQYNPTQTNMFCTLVCFVLTRPFGPVLLEWCHVSIRLQILFWRLSKHLPPYPTPPPALIVSITAHHPHVPIHLVKLIHSLKQSSPIALSPWRKVFLFPAEWNSRPLSFFGKQRAEEEKCLFVFFSFPPFMVEPHSVATFWPQSHSSEILVLGKGWLAPAQWR